MSESTEQKPSFTASQAAVQITRDNISWSSGLGQGVTDLTYGFRATRPPDDYGDGEGKTFSQVNDEQRAATLKAVAAWADVARIEFKAVDPNGYTDDATILVANFVEPGVESKSAAHAYAPSTKDLAYISYEGDFWFNIRETVKGFDYGSHNYTTVLHELGHSLGLEHPGNYNAGDERKANYKDNAVYREDSLQYAVMSYFDAAETGARHAVDGTTYIASTPLLHDIAAIQRLYGANMSTRTGDTIYGFNSTEKGTAFDITSADQQVVLSIWDAGGINTLDLSGYASDQLIDLRAGHFSSAGALTENISIAFGTVIHDGIGGSGNDTIYGNDANNMLTGGAGNDFLDGGLGINAALFAGPLKNYGITLTAGTSPFAVENRFGSDDTDTVVSIQELRFADQTLTTTDLVLSRGLYSKDKGFFGDAYNIFTLYIAEENRAPDALGLYYWAGRIAEGATSHQLADTFFAQPETQTVYSASLDNEAFVEAAYDNLFNRAPDQAGLAYWVNDLAHGASRGQLLFNVALGAQNDDKKIIDNKILVARNFSQTQGLTNADWGRDVLAGVDASTESVEAAYQKIGDYAAMAAAPQTAELVVKLIGVTSENAPA